MGKSLTIALTLLFLCDGMTADAQLFKKWKKKKQQQVEVAEVPQAVNLDTLQLPMADIATCSDNRFNRMAFLGIPLGISAKGFHDRLTAQGFSEPADQQNHYYLYQGTAYGGQLRLILMQSDSTRTVYAVDIEETTIRQTEAAVARAVWRRLCLQQRGAIYHQHSSGLCHPPLRADDGGRWLCHWLCHRGCEGK